MKIIWRLCKRVVRTPFGITLGLFLVLQVLVLLVVWIVSREGHSHMPEFLASRGLEQVYTAFLLLSVYALVALNTVLFIKHSHPEIAPLGYLSGLSETAKKRIKGQFFRFNFFLNAGVWLSGAMIFAVFTSFFPPLASNEYWAWVLRVNVCACSFSVWRFSIC